MNHLLRGHYSSVIAPTDSCATPVELSPPSVSSLVRGVFAGCYQPLRLAGLSRLYLCKSFPRCLVPYPDGPPSACTCFFPGAIGLPQDTMGRLPVSFRERDFPRASFRGCRHFVMFRPPSLLASQIAPTAASLPTGQPRLLRPGISCFVTSARSGSAIRLLQVIDGERTCTFQDLQPCRLLQWTH